MSGRRLLRLPARLRPRVDRIRFWISWRLHRRSLPQPDSAPTETARFGIGGASYPVYFESLGEESVVYSFGVGNDISFDRSLIDIFGVQIWAFDPTDEAARFIEAAQLPEGFRFRQWAIGACDGLQPLREIKPGDNMYFPGTILPIGENRTQRSVTSLSLRTIMCEFGHDRVNLLKLDIEGAEYEVLQSLVRTGDLPIDQLVLEVHPHLLNIARSGRMTGRYGWQRTAELLSDLQVAGFRIAAMSDRGTEFCLLRDGVRGGGI